MNKPAFFPADAHEGPVWVKTQQRLYYTTKTHLDGRRRVDIEFLDFSPFANLREAKEDTLEAQTWLRDARMANGMRLHQNGRQFLVAEQGDENRPAAVTLLDIESGDRSKLIDRYDDKYFNSINKVIQSSNGSLIFSDPDYGFRQGFKPVPELEPNLYILHNNGQLNCFRCGLEMPHGLALNPDESTLFVSDTSNDGAHEESIELDRRRSVWKFDFDAERGTLTGPGRCCFAVDTGVPDGMITSDEHLLVAGGDGVYVSNLEGKLLTKIPLEHGAVNLTFGDDATQLFVTSDRGVYLLLDWKKFL